MLQAVCFLFVLVTTFNMLSRGNANIVLFTHHNYKNAYSLVENIHIRFLFLKQVAERAIRAIFLQNKCRSCKWLQQEVTNRRSGKLRPKCSTGPIGAVSLTCQKLSSVYSYHILSYFFVRDECSRLGEVCCGVVPQG